MLGKPRLASSESRLRTGHSFLFGAFPESYKWAHGAGITKNSPTSSQTTSFEASPSASHHVNVCVCQSQRRATVLDKRTNTHEAGVRRPAAMQPCPSGWCRAGICPRAGESRVPPLLCVQFYKRTTTSISIPAVMRLKFQHSVE